MSIVISFALSSAVVTVLSPCAFPFIPASLAYYLGNNRTRLNGALGGIAAMVGALAFALPIGLLAMWRPTLVNSTSRWIFYFELMAGLAALLMGIILLLGLRSGVRFLFRVPTIPLPSRRGYPSLAVYGASYSFGGIGCNPAPMLGVVTLAVAEGGLQGFLIYALFAAGVAFPMFLIFAFSDELTQWALPLLRRHFDLVEKLGGLTMMGVGAYLLYFYFSEAGGLLV